MVIISSIEDSDLGELAALYEELTGRKTNTALMRSLFTKIAGNPDYILIGARDQDQNITGSAMGIVCTDIVGECKPFLVLENVIVSTKCRRQGIGRNLIQYIEKWAWKRDCYYIMLVSLSERTGAHKFYEANGYKAGVVQGFKKYL